MSSAAAEPVRLIGREAELGTADRLLETMLGGRGALLLVGGETGIGKTALAMAIGQRAQVRGSRFAVGRCYETNAMPAFASWLELLADLRTARSDLPRLPAPFGDATPSRTAFELLQSVTRVLLGHAREQPLVLCLEDVHWADGDTLELLWFFSRELRNVSALMLATFRTEDVHRDHPLAAMLTRLQHDCPTEMLRLAELRPDDTTHFVESHLGACSPELAAQLHARSEGNPFYIIELLRDLRDQRLLKSDRTGRWLPPSHGADMPSMLQHMILQRVVRLGSDVETLLTTAAVVGVEWELAVVERVLGWDEARLLAALEAALRSHIVLQAGESPDAYRFAHALPREALYGQLVVRRRRRLHREVGVALESYLGHGRDESLNVALAAQFAAAEDWQRTVEYATRAGDWAHARNATHSALRLYTLARDAAQRLDARVDTPDRGDVATRLTERIAKLHVVLNQLDDAEYELSHVIRLARERGDGTAESEALAWQSVICARMNRMGEAIETADAAVRVAGETRDRRVRALAHRSVAHMRMVNGDIASGFDQAQLGAQLARDGDAPEVLASCLYDLALMATWRGDYGAGEHLAEEALRLADEGHDVALFTSACFCLGLVRIERGRYLAARQALQLGLNTATEAGERRNVAKLMNTLGALYEEVFDLDASREWNQRALDSARNGSDVAVMEAERYSLLNLASTALHAGEVEGAAGYLDEVAPKLDTTPYSRFRYLNRYQLLRAELCLATQDRDQARRWAEEARALAMAKGVRKNVAKSWLLSGRALIGDGSATAAIENLRQGLAIADTLQHASLTWLGRLWLAQALESLRPAEARETYRAAHRRIESIAATLADQRLQECFMSSPPVRAVVSAVASESRQVRPNGGSRVRPVNAAGLTARELDVLRLVAVGATNAYIGQVLSISPRTVDVHMTSILSKTGCANRAAAVGFALRHGLT